MKRTFRALLAGTAAIALPLSAVGVASAIPLHHHTMATAATSWSGTKELGMRVVSSWSFASTTSSAFSAVPGASISFNVPAGITETIVITFSAGSLCQGGSNTANCDVTVNVDNTDLPVDPWMPAGTSTDVYNYTSLAYTWATTVTAGSHTVTMDYSTGGSGETFSFNNYTMDLTAYEA